MHEPYLDAGLRGCIVRTAQKNAWRLPGWEINDLIQEGYLCYAVVRDRYVGRRPRRKPDGTRYTSLPPNPTKANRRHFMRLWQATFRNRITTLQRGQQDLLLLDLAPGDPEVTEATVLENMLPPVAPPEGLGQLIQSMPMELKQLIQLVVSDAEHAYRRFGKRRPRNRETTNQHYCRLLGLPRNLDLMGWVQRYVNEGQ